MTGNNSLRSTCRLTLTDKWTHLTYVPHSGSALPLSVASRPTLGKRAPAPRRCHIVFYLYALHRIFINILFFHSPSRSFLCEISHGNRTFPRVSDEFPACKEKLSRCDNVALVFIWKLKFEIVSFSIHLLFYLEFSWNVFFSFIYFIKLHFSIKSFTFIYFNH